MNKDTLKNIGPLVTTLFIFALVAWALYHVFGDRTSVPTTNDKGEVTLDVYGRSKDILLVVLPLATTAVGYWLGNKGTADAKDDAKTAQAQKDAVIAASDKPLPEGVDDVLGAAKKAHPEAFGLA